MSERNDFGAGRGGAGDLIAWRGGEAVDRARFLAEVASLVAELEARGGRRWLVATESTYACAVALLATWSARCTAVLPPNREPGTLGEVADLASGIVTDVAEVPGSLQRVAVHDPARRAASRELAVALDEPGIELCTSGSTGKRKVIVKTPRQLAAEVETLERTFGTLAQGARVLGSVSHQHIYGLLFRVLWPLSAGRAFEDESAVDPARLSAQLAASPRTVLIASPAHLERLHEFFDLARFAGRTLIFSSGGPLDRRAALRFEAACGEAPIEVLGSTETGGIAWRRRRADDEAELWTAFAGASIELRDGLLSVASPNTGGERLVTGDAIERVDERRFRLLGRADRIVKLHEERVALPEVESRAAEHAWVARAAAVVVERGGAERIGLVVEPSAAGLAALSSQGKSAAIAALRAHLAPFFRPTVLPRAWRFVERIPEDAQGKRNQETLRALFAAEAQEPLVSMLGEPARHERGLTFEFEVPRDPWFVRGHFPQNPIVPGVVQVQWAIEGAAAWFGRDVTPREVLALKFKDMLVPGQRLRLELTIDEPRSLVTFRLADAAKEYSSGRIVVA